MRRLEGKVALISGASGGQGAEEARLFANEGAAVAVCDISDAAGQKVVDDIVAAGGKARYFHLDVRKEGDWQNVTEQVYNWQGDVTVLVNNAGIVHRTGVLSTKLDDWQRVMDINLTGPLLGMRAIVPMMKRAQVGSIINISSIAGLAGFYDVPYASSKWALRGLTKSAAMEFVGSNIRVNAICPGLVVTPLNEGAPYIESFNRMIPMHRPGKLSEIAYVALFLASGESSYITGEDFVVDGGLTAGAATRRIQQEAGVIPAD